MDKFDYTGGACAPYKLVMTIIAGNLNYTGGGAVPIPGGSDIYGGWGMSCSGTMVSGDKIKSLPGSLSIIFFSYLEDQFYRGDFELPYDKILELFQQGYYSYSDHKKLTYDEIVVGVAPGGTVAVWLRGIGKSTEVFFGQASKIKGRWDLITRNTMPRKEYIYESLLDSLGSPEAVAEMQKQGPPIGLWVRYRTRYHWQPELANIKLRDDLIYGVAYLNGELGDIPYPIPGEQKNITRAIPKDMNFVWLSTNGVARVTRLHFDADEILTAFEGLCANQQLLRLEIRDDDVNGKHEFSVWLHNDKQTLELKHTKVETFGAGPKMY